MYRFLVKVPYSKTMTERAVLPLDEFLLQHGEPRDYSRVLLYLVMPDYDYDKPICHEHHYLLGKYPYYTVRGLHKQPAEEYCGNWALVDDIFPPRNFPLRRGTKVSEVVDVEVPKPRTKLETRWAVDGWEKLTKKGGWVSAY